MKKLKILAIAMLACVSAFAFAGCTQQNNKLTKDDAYSLYKNAVYDLLLNNNDICSNLVFTRETADSDYSDKVEYSYYKTDSGDYVALIETEGYGYELYYETADGVYYYSVSDISSGSPDVYKTEYEDCQSIFEITSIPTNLVSEYVMSEVTQDNIISYSKLTNGNTEVKILLEQRNAEVQFFIFTYEINSKGQFVSLDATMAYLASDYDDMNRFMSATGTYTYGNVDKINVLSILASAKVAPLSK